MVTMRASMHACMRTAAHMACYWEGQACLASPRISTWGDKKTCLETDSGHGARTPRKLPLRAFAQVEQLHSPSHPFCLPCRWIRASPLIALFSLTTQVDQTGATLNVSLFSLGGITWTNVSIPAPPSMPASAPAPPPALAPTESSSTGSISRRMLLQAGPLPLPGAPPGVGGGPPGSGPQPPRPASGGPPGSTQPPLPSAGGPPGSTQPPQPAAGGPPVNGAQPPRPAGSSSCVGAITRCVTKVLPPIGERRPFLTRVADNLHLPCL